MILLTLILIRIALIYYFIKFIIKTKGCLNRILLLFLIFFYGIVNIFSALPPRKHGHIRSREKACYSNIRVISGAMEMYNMDHDTMMTTLDLNTLQEQNYLKKINPPDDGCEYHSQGNFTDNGYVYCSKHGDIEGFTKSKEEEEEIKNSTFLDSFISKIWSLEMKIDNFLLSLINPLLNKVNSTTGQFLFIILSLFGFVGEPFSCIGIGSSLIYLFIFTHLKEDDFEDKENVVYEVVYNAEDENQINTDISNKDKSNK